MIELFGNISGLQLNNSKTEALWTGANDESDLKLRPEKNLVRENQGLKKPRSITIDTYFFTFTNK